MERARKPTADGPVRQRESGALPDDVQSRMEAAFGTDFSAVRIHEGARAASLGAQAVTEGNDIHFAAGHYQPHTPGGLELLGHELTHVVQQRNGRVRATAQAKGADLNADPALEREADDLGARAARGARVTVGAAPSVPTLGATGAVAQCKLFDGTGDKAEKLPTTWKGLEKEPKKRLDLGKAALKAAEKELGGGVDADRLLKCWNKIAGNKTSEAFDINDTDTLAVELAKRYRASARSAQGFGKRNADATAIAQPLLDEDSELYFQKSARNPMVRKKDDDMTAFPVTDYTSKGAPPREDQVQTHIGTTIFAAYGGEEAQASLAKDKTGVIVSTNTNETNKKLADLTSTKDIEKLAADVAVSKGLGTMTREQAMNDIEVRHAMKLFARLKDYLVKAAVVTVPDDVEVQLNGRHAEIRIKTSDTYGTGNYRVPTGVKYPCMGCKLYFNDQGIDTGVEMGPAWITSAALSTQMEASMKKGEVIGKLSDPDSVGQTLAAQFKKLPDTVEMGWGTCKDGTTTLLHKAESDSEMEDSEFESVKKEMVKKGPQDQPGQGAGGRREGQAEQEA